MTRARVKYGVDLSQFDVYRAESALKLQRTLHWVERQGDAELESKELSFHCGAFDYATSEEAQKLHLERIKELWSVAKGRLFPWLDDDTTKAKQYESLIDLWRATFYDERTPEGQEKIKRSFEGMVKATGEAMKKQRRRGRP